MKRSEIKKLAPPILPIISLTMLNGKTIYGRVDPSGKVYRILRIDGRTVWVDIDLRLVGSASLA